jgi:hypothetical protein
MSLKHTVGMDFGTFWDKHNNVFSIHMRLTPKPANKKDN